MTSTPDRENTLGSLLRRPYDALQDHVYRSLLALGFEDVRMAHSAVFRHIDPEGTRITTLAERAGMTKQSMGYLVDALVEAGYVVLQPDPNDGRAKLAVLTRRGAQAVEVLLEQSRQFESALARRIGARKLEQLRALLVEVSDALRG